jgi:SpoVK/Ycf46/Vps4 family AAA+-type ATPase
MAKAEHIKAMVRSHAEGDEARFYSIAMQVAAQAAHKGQATFAKELRDLVDEAKASRRPRSVDRDRHRPGPLAQPRGDLAGLLSVAYPRVRLSALALDDELAARLTRVVAEQRQRSRLLELGFTPARKLLLVGPPGTGKTMTSHAVAGELGLPLFTARLDGLITKFLGETAARLRSIFDAITSTRAVYLFDEFDALGGRRSNSNDTGEIRRVLNSFLQFIELDESDSLVIAATNHVDILDPALFRRFDGILRYGLPSTTTAHEVMLSRLATIDTVNVDWSQVLPAVTGLSHADLCKASEQAAKTALLSGRAAVETSDLVCALQERQGRPE